MRNYVTGSRFSTRDTPEEAVTGSRFSVTGSHIYYYSINSYFLEFINIPGTRNRFSNSCFRFSEGLPFLPNLLRSGAKPRLLLPVFRGLPAMTVMPCAVPALTGMAVRPKPSTSAQPQPSTTHSYFLTHRRPLAGIVRSGLP